MAEIHILSHETIDKIAAGEVVERPLSIVKELVENAIDAGATAVTVEIREGGISLIRVSDNGCGIEKSEVRKAFLRHATSKIEDAEDLLRLRSLGFRGEALSSICAVSRTEMITKTAKELTGVRISMEGSVETDFEEVGAPDGTTIIVRNLFFNVPARRKFLKQPATEGGYVADLMEHLALANPGVSFQFIQNNQVKFSTAGNGNLKQTIYKLYGKDMAEALIEIDRQGEGIRLHGYLGKPSCNRANRNYELYFLNGRFIKSRLVSRALEEGYRSYVMQHRYPFCVLMLETEPSFVDVNVHPTKMEVRFMQEMQVFAFLSGAVKEVLDAHEMIPRVALTEEKEQAEKERALEPFQKARFAEQTETEKTEQCPGGAEKRLTQEKQAAPPRVTSKDFFVDFDGEEEQEGFPAAEEKEIAGVVSGARMSLGAVYPGEDVVGHNAGFSGTTLGKVAEEESLYQAEQMDLFEEKIFSQASRPKFRILGQAFDTYWIVVYEDKLLMIDQHAAHEKVKYERIMKAVKESGVVAQYLYPPLVLTLSGREQEILERYRGSFEKLGFELEYFGGKEITIRSAPADLFGSTIKGMFLEVLDELSVTGIGRAKSVEERIATMACKAAVKGNMSMSMAEMEALLDELLTLDNPYFCPHGRPTIISFTKQELEKKFKRIV